MSMIDLKSLIMTTKSFALPLASFFNFSNLQCFVYPKFILPMTGNFAFFRVFTVAMTSRKQETFHLSPKDVRGVVPKTDTTEKETVKWNFIERKTFSHDSFNEEMKTC